MTASLATMAVFGAAIGSFLNVVIYRLPRGESLVHPGSRCPGCTTAIPLYDNVPVVSWLLLGGRCRSCRQPISVRYPVVELLTALAFAAVTAARAVSDDLLLFLPFAALLIAVAGIDLDRRIVPNQLILPATAWGVVGAAALRPEELITLLAAGGIAFAALLVVVLVYPSGMGMGDVKLAGVMGLYLGSAVAPALLLAFLAGSLVGVALMVRDGSAARKRAVPFAPFLALGGLAGLIVGPELVTLYASNFL